MANPRVYNLKGLRDAIFAQLDWAPSQDDEAKSRADELIDRAYMELCGDAPFLFFEDEKRMAIHPDIVPTGTTDRLRKETTNNDAWVMETELTLGDPLLVGWPGDPTWNGRYVRIKDAGTTPVEWKLTRIREQWFDLGTLRWRISLEIPWGGVHTSSLEYQLVSDEYVLPNTLVELKSISLVDSQTAYPYPLELIGQQRAEFATYPHNTEYRSAGSPRVAFRREYQQPLPAPTLAPVLTANADGPPPQTWLGPEAIGQFEYLYTYVWGVHELQSASPGPATQTSLSVDLASRLEPLFESAPSPKSGLFTTAAVAIDVGNLPNIDFMLGFDGAGTTRQNHTGIKKRIYRRRLFGNGILGHELSNKFYPIDEVAGNATVWVDDGSKTPDYSRPLRASHGYQTVRFFPRPDTRYEVVMRGVFLPEPMYNDTDVPRTTPDAGEALVCLGSSLLYEAQGEYTLANRAYEKYEKTLQRLRRRYGDLRPSGRVRRRRAARPRVRGTWNRELSGIVTDA